MKHSQVLINSFRTFLCGVILGGSLLGTSSSVMAVSPGDMVSHTGNVNYGNPMGGVSDININGNRAGIDWSQFNIAHGDTVNFNFNGSHGAVLNRVVGASPSQIHGMLNSNGAVFVVNPNGMVIGSNAQIQANAFVGSTLGVSDAQVGNFMNGGTMTFENGNGVLHNQGYIHAADGSVALIGSQVINSGTIEAPNGSAELLAGQRITASLADPSRPAFTVNTTFDVIGGTGIVQAGNINALNARLEAVGGNVYALAINNSGVIRANAITNENGRIKLVSHNGTIRNSGMLSADANVDNAHAGSIEITGGKVEMNSAIVTALGDADTGSGISIKSTDDTNITSSLLATTDANIDIQSDEGVYLTTDASRNDIDNSTLINAYGHGDVSVTGSNVGIGATAPNSRVSVGSRLGTTRVKTTQGDLEVTAANGGFAQIGYHYHDMDTRVADLGINNPLGELYFGQGNIDVYSARDIWISNTNDTNNGVHDLFHPAAMIGHALLPQSEYWLLQYPGELEWPNPAGKHLYTGGDINVVAQGDINMFSRGAAVSQIGHYAQGNVTWDSWDLNGQNTFEPRFVRGHVNVDSYGSVALTALDGGLTTIGHTADYMVSDTYGPNNYYYKTIVTASKDVILSAEANATSQIGLSMHGGDLMFNPYPKYQHRDQSNHIHGNIKVVAGENVLMSGPGNTIIGHENRLNPGFYHSTVVVAYSMNRIHEITDKSVVNQITGTLETCLEDLKIRFNGSEEGILSMDGNARIGREYLDAPGVGQLYNFTGIFGWRLKKDEASSAIRLADGAVLAGVRIDSSSTPGRYNDDFRYNLGEYPGDDALGFSYDFEHYGYTLGDYCADSLPVDIPGMNSGTGDVMKYGDVNLGIFYPVTFKDTPPPKPDPDPDPTPKPHPKPEKPYVYWPMIPTWFEECCYCCCCCVQTTCEEYIPGPCEPVRPACGPAEAEGDSLQEPTLAPTPIS